jgi:glycosyltransferase involved in cell wall biosynthesis
LQGSGVRIALIHNYYLQRGGEDHAFEDEQLLLRNHGHDVLTIQFHNRDVEKWSAAERLKRSIWNSASYNRVLQALTQHRTDIAHIHNTLAVASPSVFHAAKEAGAAVVYSVHNFRLLCLNGLFFRKGSVCEQCLDWHTSVPGIVHGCYRQSRMASAGIGAIKAGHAFMRTWQRMVDLYIAPTEFVRSKLIKGGFAPDDIAVRPHFVFDSHAERHTAYSKRRTDKPLVVFIGRLSSEKGVATLLEAWKMVPNPGAELVIIGDGPLSGDVVQAAHSDGRIHATGRLPPEEVRHFLENAALVVVPSDCYETFGKVVIEAFAAGTPVVVSGHGGLASVVNDGKEGIHFRPGDACDLASQVSALLHDRKMGERLSEGARRRFEAQFTPERVYETTLELYGRALFSSHSHNGASSVR